MKTIGASLEGMLYSCVNDTGSESEKGRSIHTHTRDADPAAQICWAIQHSLGSDRHS